MVLYIELKNQTSTGSHGVSDAISSVKSGISEEDRLYTLRFYDLLDTATEDSFDKLVKLAALVCDMPISLVSLVDDQRQWFKARVGLEAQETPREYAFCQHTILQDDVMLVADATADDRFADNPLVTGEPNIRFYAGAPLKVANGQNIGTLCVIDSKPNTLTSQQLEALETIRDTVVSLIEFRQATEALSKLESLLPMCSWCKSVNDESGSWESLADYVAKNTPTSHGICPSCSSALLRNEP